VERRHGADLAVFLPPNNVCLPAKQPLFTNTTFDAHPPKIILRSATEPLCGNHNMKIMGRHIMRLMGIGAIAIAIPQFASAADFESGAALKLAMGPTSAAQKNQGAGTTSDSPVAKCIPSEGTCPKPRHHAKRSSEPG
jgi:hypothetical protein